MEPVYKIFVGGLKEATTEEVLRDHFSQYGEVKETEIPVHKADEKFMGKSRGFGFVTFADPESMRECLSVPKDSHIVDSKLVEVKRALTKEECRPPNNLPQAVAPTKKVFVGGLPTSLTKEEFHEAMQQYGDVVEAQIMTEKGTNEPRGFGFVIFQDVETAKSVCSHKYVTVMDKQVEVKPAIPKDQLNSSKRGGMKDVPRGGGMEDYRGYGYAGGPGSYFRGPTSYGYGGGYPGDYTGYDFSRYDYMRGYGWGGHYDRGQAPSSYYKNYAGYDMSAYGAMYSGGQGMGTYSLSASSYGPSREGYGGGGDKDKDRSSSKGYHPYRR